MGDLYVTKTFLPPIAEYQAYVEKIWNENWLTNQGPLLKEFEEKVSQYLKTPNLHYVANGTVALQLSLRALGLAQGEVITTPFTYVATTSAILWEGLRPVYVDIDENTLCLDPNKIEAAITENTKAIMPVHVFGNACDVEKIDAIAKRHNLKVIYDAAHAFGVAYKDKSLLSYGDVSTCSFHATKLFQTIEGGAVISRDKKISDRVELMKRFGHHGDEHFMLGINAKASEFHAAMGLCNLPYIDQIISRRKIASEQYDQELSGIGLRPQIAKDTTPNYAYYPLVLTNEEKLRSTIDALTAERIFPRRYFYPSLNTLPYTGSNEACPISEKISSSILCLPLFDDISEADIARVSKIVRKCNA